MRYNALCSDDNEVSGVTVDNSVSFVESVVDGSEAVFFI
jgi:hypothetical protein